MNICFNQFTNIWNKADVKGTLANGYPRTYDRLSYSPTLF